MQVLLLDMRIAFVVLLLWMGEEVVDIVCVVLYCCFGLRKWQSVGEVYEVYLVVIEKNCISYSHTASISSSEILEIVMHLLFSK